MPALFIGHGSPLSAVKPDRFSDAWVRAGKGLPKPKAVLAISAHWCVRGSFVHANARPKTLHDFSGFPPELYDKTYPCPGSPEGAEEVCRVGKGVKQEREWGIDHGAWIPAKRLFPKADVPFFQLSIDSSKPPQFHFDLGRELAPLRRKGILIMASGNIAHNLELMQASLDAQPLDWAVEFDAIVRKSILSGNHGNLISYGKLGDVARFAVPEPSHYLPLLYILGMQGEDEKPAFFAEGFAYASLSMRSFRLG
jgi:4,5-DOPA dioxygenase extradiol